MKTVFSRGFLVLLSSAVLARSAEAQEVPEIVEAKVTAPAEEEKEGWRLSARVSATGSYNDVRNVVGAVEGSTIQLGAQLKGAANYRRGPHDWENTLSLNFTQSRTPTLPVFVKSTDELKLKTTYVYRVSKKFGPYAQAGFSAPVARGFDVSDTDITVQQIFRNGTTLTLDQDAFDRLELTDPFEPLTLNESAGFFAALIESAPITAKVKAGVGAEHVIVNDGFVLADDGATEELEYRQLVGSTQGGAVAEGTIAGKIAENISYDVGAKVFYAALSDFQSNDLDADEGDDFSVELDAKLAVKLTEWLSLDYVLIVKRIPWVVDATQTTNGVIVSIGYDLL